MLFASLKLKTWLPACLTLLLLLNNQIWLSGYLRIKVV